MFLVCVVDGYVLLVVLIFLDAYLSYKKFEIDKIQFRKLYVRGFRGGGDTVLGHSF